MTYNLRYASTTPPNAWPVRRPVAKAMLEKVGPDLIGTQEGLYEQLKDLAVDLPAYAWIGTGRDGGSRGEFMAVFYRKDRFEPLEFDHFWLSDTPEVIGSSTWGNQCRRMVTWVKFLDRRTKRKLYFVDTHFDHQVAEAREKSARLVLDRVGRLKTELPIILVGDFNAAAGGSRPYELLVKPGEFSDAWTAAERRGELYATYHGYGKPARDGARIDWILSRGPVRVLSSEIVTFSKDGQYPSDHFPVVARMRLESK
ncbi:MAG: endonuclease/exonuclease/phosphatase family protein [Phycisphaerae bacterium]|nr:endonuclease/exonuclease/phosphatase family protein [Phycisphaerae bacterium]